MFQKIILESIQSHRDLDFFANFILDQVVIEIQNNFDQRYAASAKNPQHSWYYFLPYLTITYSKLKEKQKYSQEFLDTLEKSARLYVSFYVTEERKTSSYDINNKEIHLYYRTNNSQSLLLDLIENNEKWLWRDFFKSQKHALIHELQHWYDGVRSFSAGSRKNSKGKIVRHDDGDKKGQPKTILRPNAFYTKNALAFKAKYGDNQSGHPDSHQEYINQYHEIIARFAETVNGLLYTRVDGPEEAVDYLKVNLYGWEHISPEIQRKLIKRIIQVYYDKYRNQKILPQIKNFIGKYKEKRKSQGYSMEIYVAPSLLSVEGLDGGNQNAIIKDLIKIANRFQQNLAIEEKSLTLSAHEMEQMGFMKNSEDDDENVDIRFTYDEYFKYPDTN